MPAPEIPVHDNPAYLPESIKGVTAEPISNPEDIPHPNLETTPLPHPGEPLIDHTYNQMPHPPELPDSGAVVPHADVPEMNTPEPIFPPHEVAPTIPSPQIVHSFEQGYHGAKFKVDIADIADKKQILVDGVKIAESVPSPNGNGGVMLQLLDKYQDGSKYAAIRTAYDTAQMDAPILKVFPKSMLGKEILQVPFEDGRIQVFHGIGADKNAVDIYLNGKEIAKGLITDKGPDVEIFKNLKGGLFLADTVYERALKHAMPLVKSFKVLKDVNK